MLRKYIAGLTIVLVLAGGGWAMAQDKAADRALMKVPAKDCAVVSGFTGLKDVKTKSYIRDITLNEGLVIRNSRIENGKIIIPPSGLYYTTRTPKSGVLQGDKVLILGKLYQYVDQSTKLDVISGVWVPKKGAAPFGDGTKVLELSKLEMGANGFPVANATFQILKQSGNYYGVSFPVATSDLFTDITGGKLKDGKGRKTGAYLATDEGQDYETEYYASSVAVSGQTYLVAEEVNSEGAKIKEFATGALTGMFISPDEPVEALLAPGDKVEGGGFSLELLELGQNTAKVKLTCQKSGESWTKEMGPLTAEVLKYMPVDEEERAKFILRDPLNRAQAQMGLYRPGGPFQDGKAALTLYTGLMELKNPSVWEPDKRFLFRPDT